MKKTTWKLHGYDTFSNEWYGPLDEFKTEEKALAAAFKRLDKLEKTQPSASSGGQAPNGIQDHVFIERPDGTKYRVTPEQKGGRTMDREVCKKCLYDELEHMKEVILVRCNSCRRDKCPDLIVQFARGGNKGLCRMCKKEREGKRE